MDNRVLNVLHRWALNGSNNDTKYGPKMSAQDQNEIAKLTKKTKYNALYRGTVVPKSDLQKKEKNYSINRLQSWTTNKKTAMNYATNFWVNNENRKRKSEQEKVVFYTTETTDRVKSYNLKDIFPNRNREVIVNRPVFKAIFEEKYYDGKVYFVPIEFVKSHENPIVPNTNRKRNTTSYMDRIKGFFVKNKK